MSKGWNEMCRIDYDTAVIYIVEVSYPWCSEPLILREVGGCKIEFIKWFSRCLDRTL